MDSVEAKEAPHRAAPILSSLELGASTATLGEEHCNDGFAPADQIFDLVRGMSGTPSLIQAASGPGARPASVPGPDLPGAGYVVELLETQARLAAVCVGRAAERATPADRLALRAAVLRCDRDGGRRRAARRAIDDRVLAISGGVAVVLLEQVAMHLVLPLRRLPGDVRALAERTFEPALPAILAGEPDAARAACEQHLSTVLGAIRRSAA